MTQSLAIPRVIPEDWKRLDLIINKIKMRLGSGGSPTFVGLTLTGLTASTLIGANASKALESITVGTGLDYTRPNLTLSHLGIEALTDPGADRIIFWDDSATPSACKWLAAGNSVAITATTLDTIQDIQTSASPQWVNLNLTGYIDQSDIADPGVPAASKSRLFSNNGHAISLSPGDVWHDLSMGGKGTSSCVHDAITITHVGGSGLNITWSAGSVFDAAISGADQMVTIAAQPANQACTASSINYLFFDRSGGVLVLNTSGPDYSDGDFSIAHILTTHNDIFEIFYRPVDKEVTHNIKWSLREAFPNIVVSGLVVSKDGTWDVDQSAGSFVHGGFTLKTASLVNSTVTNIVRWYHNADNDWETDTNANIDNANWDDDDDDATVKVTSAGKYYRSVFVTCGDCIHWVYPQVEYANIAAALAAPDPTLPPALEHLPKTTTLILKHGAATLPVAGSDQWIDSRPILGVVSTGASIADHGSLTGLLDDDHTQYIKDSEFTQDSGILVGTGAGTFQEETGATLRTSLGLVIGTDVQAYHANLTSLAGLTYAAASFVKMTGANTFALRTIGETKTDLSLNNVENTVHSTDAHTMTIDGRDVSVDGTKLDGIEALADVTATNETSHADVLIDGDFGSAGLMNTDGAGTYSIKAIGTDVQAYHANLAAIAAGTWTGAASITTLGTITTVGNITIANGGTIGQAAGPLLTFNDTTNKLGITGCSIGIGTLTPETILNIVDEGAGRVYIDRIYSDQYGSNIGFRKARGSIGSEVIVNNGDNVGIFSFNAYDGSGYHRLASVRGAVDGAPSDGTDMPGRLEFYTAPDGTSVDVIRMTLKSNGNLGIGLTVPKTKLTVEGTLTLKEQANADGDTAAYGQIWVKTATPNQLWFTDDGGADIRLGRGYEIGSGANSFATDLDAINTWQDLDLSGEVGSNYAVVFLEVTHYTGDKFAVKPKGEGVADVTHHMQMPLGAGFGTCAIYFGGQRVAYLTCTTDASGVIQIASDVDDSEFYVKVIGYII